MVVLDEMLGVHLGRHIHVAEGADTAVMIGMFRVMGTALTLDAEGVGTLVAAMFFQGLVIHRNVIAMGTRHVFHRIVSDLIMIGAKRRRGQFL